MPWEMWASGAVLAGGYCKTLGGWGHSHTDMQTHPDTQTTDKGMHVHHVHLHMYPP